MTICILTLIQPSYFDQRLQPRGVASRGVDATPLDFGLLGRIFGEIIHGYVFGVKESNGDS